jgi:hypothetical protein
MKRTHHEEHEEHEEDYSIIAIPDQIGLEPPCGTAQQQRIVRRWEKKPLGARYRPDPKGPTLTACESMLQARG